MDVDQARKLVRTFAEGSCEQSPLYKRLSWGISDDKELIEIVCATPDGQPIPNLLLAAVHFLLLSGTPHELASYFASIVETPLAPDGAVVPFRAFCLEHEEAIRRLMRTRRVQTNEVSRSAYLLPAFSFIRQHITNCPLAIIEVGTSAGLLLNFDRYCYDYGTGELYGNTDSEVRIRSEWRGHIQPTIVAALPNIMSRIGIDLHVVNVADGQETLWLQSLVWPDQPNRRSLILAAIREYMNHPASLIEGDGMQLLSTAIESVSEEATVCVFHCHTLNQFAEERRQDFFGLLSECSKRRLVIQISAEWIRTPQPELRLCQHVNGEVNEVHLANVDQHGRWIEWKNTQ